MNGYSPSEYINLKRCQCFMLHWRWMCLYKNYSAILVWINTHLCGELSSSSSESLADTLMVSNFVSRTWIPFLIASVNLLTITDSIFSFGFSWNKKRTHNSNLHLYTTSNIWKSNWYEKQYTEYCWKCVRWKVQR